MPAQIIESTDIIDVSSVAVLIFGPPGTGKTSLAQTAADPITLDLDRGAHRSFNRGTIMRFDAWGDIEEAQPEIVKRKTVVVDTVGRALDLISVAVINENGKWGTRAGGLSLQGFGVLKTRYANWNNQLWAAGKDRVLIAHEKEERDGDERIVRPDVQGGSYAELMKSCDLVGYLYRDRQGKRWLDFNPTDRHLGKNAAGWPLMEVPDLAVAKTFLADLIADAKAKIGKTAEASALLAKEVGQWEETFTKGLTMPELNSKLADIKALEKHARIQVWHLTQEYAKKEGWVFSEPSKQFVLPPKETNDNGAAEPAKAKAEK